MGIQIVATVISLFVLGRALQKLKTKTIKFSIFFAWFLFWALVIAFVWQPGLTDRIAGFLRVGRGADVISYLSLILIFYLIFKIFMKLERIDQDITVLVRSMAIIDKEHKDHTYEKK
jgi:hypothetical protein